MDFGVTNSLIIAIGFITHLYLSIHLESIGLSEFDPYSQLIDIRCWDGLRNNKGQGLKRFLAAIQYEKEICIVKEITSFKSLIIVVLLYIILTMYYSNNGIIEIRIVATTIPVVTPVFTGLVSLRLKNLQKKIGG